MTEVSFEDVLATIKKKAEGSGALKATAKFDIDGEGVIYIDGTGEQNVVTADDKDADVTISISIDTLVKLRSGELNGMKAMVSGLIKITGSMTVAMKVQSLMS